MSCGPVCVRLLTAFELTAGGRPVELPAASERLLAFLALTGRPVSRSSAAGLLWSDVSEDRACGNLRTTIWRMRRPGMEVIDCCAGGGLRLAPGVTVDVNEMEAQARRLLGVEWCEETDYDCRALSADLLPTWGEDWVIVERERLRQLRLHALERLCERLAAARRYLDAIDAALAAIRAEPLRESAHRALIDVYIAEGNYSEAIAEYRSFRRLLWKELGVTPSELMEAQVCSLTRH